MNRWRIGFWIAGILVILGLVILRRDIVLRDFSWNDSTPTGAEPIMLSEDVIYGPDKQLAVMAASVVHQQPKSFTLKLRVRNQGEDPAFLGFAAETRGQSWIFSGATYESDIVEIEPGNIYELERDFRLSSSLQNEVKLRLAKCKNRGFLMQDGVRHLPPDADVFWNETLALPRADSVESQ